ncbi:hypothetical protein, partial [Thiocapsa sp. UBA6158]|uniref:hypothetical protein n=1 Tax=Thiocapsa sp. UBA6158 TaxID=1947692 RepID=UPI0025DC0248
MTDPNPLTPAEQARVKAICEDVRPILKEAVAIRDAADKMTAPSLLLHLAQRGIELGACPTCR